MRSTLLAFAAFGLAFQSGMISAAETQVHRDVAYGSDDEQKLDIFVPQGAEGALPVVVWVHGGGWQEGDKRDGVNGVHGYAQQLVDAGYVAASCNYRLSPDHPHPAQIDDVQRMVRWIRAHAGEYHIDPDRVGVIGISAGGHLVAMLAAKGEHEPQGDELDSQSSRVTTAVSLAGPTDFVDTPDLMTKELRDAVAAPVKNSDMDLDQFCREFSPVRFVDARTAPVLFIVGTNDPWVPPRHADVMAAAMTKAGAENEVLALEGKGHGIFPHNTPEVVEASLEWFGKHLAPKQK